MEPTDLKPLVAKVTFSATGAFDDFYLQVIVNMFESSYKIDSYTVTQATTTGAPHVVAVHINKDTSEVNIKDIKTPLVQIISLGELELGEEDEFDIDVEAHKDGTKVLTKRVRHGDASGYERPIPA
ncbi:MAG: hypothetical protein AAFW00_11495 [Bacteroidota bacterium]